MAHHARWILALILSCPLTLAAAEHDPAPNIVGETIGQVAARTGYTVEEIVTYFPPVVLEMQEDGLARDRFEPPPEPYVHPRIFFNPEDLPDLRHRLSETASGKSVMFLVAVGHSVKRSDSRQART